MSRLGHGNGKIGARPAALTSRHVRRAGAGPVLREPCRSGRPERPPAPTVEIATRPSPWATTAGTTWRARRWSTELGYVRRVNDARTIRQSTEARPTCLVGHRGRHDLQKGGRQVRHLSEYA